MNLPLPVLAFLMVFAAAACVLLLLGLGVLSGIILSSIADRARGLTAANTAHRMVPAPKQKQDREKEPDALPLAARLLKTLLLDEDRENIIGDIAEEFSLFEAKLKAHLWLYKQVFTSAWPLICKRIEKKLASVFRKSVR
jgi:hypothetical protein